MRRPTAITAMLMVLSLFALMAAGALPQHATFLPLVEYRGQVLGTTTPVATYSPTVVPTPTYTPPSTVSPTLVRILNTHTTYTSLLGRHIVGEVRNLASYPVGAVVIRAGLYDDSNHQLGTVTGSPLLYRIEPNEKVCFNILTPNDVGAWTRYTLDVTQVLGPFPHRPKLAVSNVAPQVSPYNPYMLTGRVRNDESITLWAVTVAGALYDVQGRILDCSHPVAPAIESLAPGATWDFAIPFPRPGVSPASYTVKADGYRTPTTVGQ